MFDIGFWEIIIIGIVSLLVVGPDKLPGLVKEVLKWTRMLRQFITSTRREFEREFNFDVDKDLKAKISDLDKLMEIAPDKQPEQDRKEDQNAA